MTLLDLFNAAPVPVQAAVIALLGALGGVFSSIVTTSLTNRAASLRQTADHEHARTLAAERADAEASLAVQRAQAEEDLLASTVSSDTACR